jgi:hypothetical protein
VASERGAIHRPMDIGGHRKKGARWNQEISQELESTRVGIICLTADNLKAPWILFESGALSKTRDAFVCTFLLDIKPASIEPPLGQFQHTTFEKADVYHLLQTINRAVGTSGERALTESQLEGSFEVWWPRLEKRLKDIPSSNTKSDGVQRRDRDLLEEILEMLRGIHRPVAPSAHEVVARETPDLTPDALNVYQVTVPDAANWDVTRRHDLVTKLSRSLPPNVVVRVRWDEAGSDLALVFYTQGAMLTRLMHSAKSVAPDGTEVHPVSDDTFSPADLKDPT